MEFAAALGGRGEKVVDYQRNNRHFTVSEIKHSEDEGGYLPHMIAHDEPSLANDGELVGFSE